MGYAGIVRVALVAITPNILLKTVLWLADISFPYAWLLYFAVAMGYLAFGLSSNRGGSDSEGAVLQSVVLEVPSPRERRQARP